MKLSLPAFTSFVLFAFEVVDLVAIAIHETVPVGAHDGRAAIAAIKLHALAAFSFPGKHLVVVLEAGDQRVVKLPVVFELIAAA